MLLVPVVDKRFFRLYTDLAVRSLTCHTAVGTHVPYRITLVLPATQQRWHSRPYPSRSWYLIKRPRRHARLSWPSWLVTYQDNVPTQRQSPIQLGPTCVNFIYATNSANHCTTLPCIVHAVECVRSSQSSAWQLWGRFWRRSRYRSWVAVRPPLCWPIATHSENLRLCWPISSQQSVGWGRRTICRRRGTVFGRACQRTASSPRPKGSRVTDTARRRRCVVKTDLPQCSNGIEETELSRLHISNKVK